MIKNYSKYIKESVQPDGPPPFNLKEFNPYNDVYAYYKEKYQSNGFEYGEWSKKYVDYMLKILEKGKFVIFYGNSTLKDGEKQNRGYIKDAIQPNDQKAVIHIILDDDIEYGMYPHETVRIFDEEPEKIHKEDDPYGEEEWYD